MRASGIKFPPEQRPPVVLFAVPSLFPVRVALSLDRVVLSVVHVSPANILYKMMFPTLALTASLAALFSGVQAQNSNNNLTIYVPGGQDLWWSTWALLQSDNPSVLHLGFSRGLHQCHVVDLPH